MPAQSNPQKIHIDLSGRPKETINVIFYKWAINFGRVIIVLTELIALLALGYRFKVDRDIHNLHDQIRKEEIYVKYQADKEARYRSIQERLSLVKLAGVETTAKLDVMNDVLQAINDGTFTGTNLVVYQNTITLDGATFSVFDLNSTINSFIQKHKNIKTVSLSEINSTPQGVKFKLTIELKEQAGSLL